MISSVNIDWIV